jgi:hypothetical protein
VQQRLTPSKNLCRPIEESSDILQILRFFTSRIFQFQLLVVYHPHSQRSQKLHLDRSRASSPRVAERSEADRERSEHSRIRGRVLVLENLYLVISPFPSLSSKNHLIPSRESKNLQLQACKTHLSNMADRNCEPNRCYHGVMEL